MFQALPYSRKGWHGIIVGGLLVSFSTTIVSSVKAFHTI